AIKLERLRKRQCKPDLFICPERRNPAQTDAQTRPTVTNRLSPRLFFGTNQMTDEPRFRKRPVTPYRRMRTFQFGSHFLVGHPRKKLHLHDSRSFRIETLQTIEQIVHVVEFAVDQRAVQLVVEYDFEASAAF